MRPHFFKRRKILTSPQLVVAYEAACQRLLEGVTKAVRKWEKQSIRQRKSQLGFSLAGLLLLGSFSVCVTATGHFFTRLTHKNHDQQPSVRNAGPGPFRRK